MLKTATLTCAILLWCGLSGPLSAHPGVQNNMQISFSEDQLIITTEVALREILLVHGLKDEEQGGLDADAIAAAANRHESYLKSHFEVTALGQPLIGGVLSHTPPTVYDTPSRTKYVFRIRYYFGRLRPAEVSLRQTMLREFSVTGGHPWHVEYIIRVTQADGKMELASLAPSQKVTLRTGIDTAPPGTTEGTPMVAGPAVEDDEPSWLERHRVPLAIALVALGGLGVVVFILRRGARDENPPS